MPTASGINDHDITLDIDTRQLDEALSRLPVLLQKRIVRVALRAAGDVLVESIRREAPERTDELPGGNSLAPGILKADISAEVIVTSDTIARVRVGPTSITGHVARWIDHGFTLTSHGRKRKRVAIKRRDGKPNPIPGTYFIERGSDEAADAALTALIDGIADGLGMELRGYEGVGKDEDYSGENY